MRGTKRKIGMFGNAKYSRPVFRNVPISVIEGASKDIAALIKPSSSNVPTQKLRQMSQMEHEIEPPVYRKNLGMKRSRRDMFDRNPRQQQILGNNHSNEQSANAPWVRDIKPRIKESEKHQQHRPAHPVFRTVSPAGTELDRTIAADFGNSPARMIKKVSPQSQRHFPSEPPLQKIVRNMLVSFPQLTLKNNEPMEYADAAFTVARNVLQTQLYQASLREKSIHDNTTIVPEIRIDETAFTSIRNKTMNFDMDYQTESDDWSQDGNMDNESPTNFDWNTAEVPDPYTIHQAFCEIDQQLANSHTVNSKLDDFDEFCCPAQETPMPFEWMPSQGRIKTTMSTPLSPFSAEVTSPESMCGSNLSEYRYEEAPLNRQAYF